MKRNAAKAVLLAGLLMILTSMAVSDVIPTPFAAWFFDDTSTFNGELIPVGSVIDAFDEDGTHCGSYTVTTPGEYGYLLVYGDDSRSTVDEGAVANDTLSFTINDREADVEVISGSARWAQDTESQLRLSVSTALIQFSLVQGQNDTLAAPGWTVRMKATILNEGDGLDFYGVDASIDQATWSTSTVGSNMFYAAAAEQTDVYFDVIVPVWPGDTTGTVIYSVYSHLDPTVTVEDTVALYVSTTDVGDDPSLELPGSFTLQQNYPNPFNPTTTIPFALPAESPVRLEIYNALGQLVSSEDMGSLPAGAHQYEFDASSLASGVYLYRLVTEQAAESRKMVLLK